LKVVKRKFSDLKQYENNPRNNSNAVSKVKESIRKYGYKVFIVIDQFNTIVAGHTRFAALLELQEELGYPNEIDCILADDLTDEQINEFRIVDNLTAENADWDITKLKLELELLPNLDLELFGEVPALTFEDIQIEEENKVELSDKIRIQVGGDKIEITEAEYHEWVVYVIERYNMSILDFVRSRLELRPSDRSYEKVTDI
jgi:ParB-like chromosome segregation protein Spo0J